MRLKEILKRLAEIRASLEQRDGTMTSEDLLTLENEVKALQEEREAIVKDAEKRTNLLNNIANSIPGTPSNSGEPTLLRGIGEIGGEGKESRNSDPLDTTEYRTAFMNYVCRNQAIPKELRTDEMITVADSGAVIPTTIMAEIITKLESYGNIYAKVRKLNIQGGVEFPIADLKPVARWITEDTPSGDQKLTATTSVSFQYNGLECKIAQSVLANVVTLNTFSNLFIPLATEALVKAIEIAIFKGTGSGQPLGITVDPKVKKEITLTPSEYASWNGWHKVKGMMKKAYRTGEFVMNQSTFDNGIDGMVDENGQPVGRTNYGIDGEEKLRFMGKEVETVEDEILPAYEDAAVGDVIAVFVKLSDYGVNSNMELTVNKWIDHDTNKLKNQVMLVCDGKLIDANGVILIKKGAAV